MKKNKIVALILIVFIFLGLTGCGSKTGVVSYANYDKIVTVTEDANNATSFSGTIVLLGTPASNTSTFNGTGVVEWTEGEATIIVTFANFEAVDKSQTGLFATSDLTPIGSKDSWTDWVVKQVAIFTFHASNLFGLLGSTYFYWIGLLFMTLVIRTIGWPIYAKSNDMTIKMQIAQPELTKLQDKYKGKTDQASKQRMQMETMEIYKKYKINLFGCFMPLLQMPIFLAMYSVVRRFPVTDTAVFGNGSAVMNYSFLWTDLGNTNWLENLPLAIIVAATMFLSQWIMQKRTRANQKNNRYQDAKAQQSQKMMKFMMYFMILMMAYISIGNAGIAFYWILGNSYQLLQSYVSHKQADKKQEAMRKQF